MKEKLLEDLLDFAVHLFVGAVMFLLLGLTALGVGLFAEYVDGVHYSVVIHFGLKLLEYLMFGADGYLVAQHVFRGLAKLTTKT